MRKIIVVNDPAVLDFDLEDAEVITPRKYLTDPRYSNKRNIRVFNLCNEYRYQSKGYYVSLLAEARGHKPIPDVKKIQDLKAPAMLKNISEELDAQIQKSLKKIRSDEFLLSIYFGRNLAKQYEKLSQELHKLLGVPLMRVKFTRNGKWTIQHIRTIGWKEIPESHVPFVRECALAYFSRKRYSQTTPEIPLYDLAILVNPDETAPPSNQEALAKFKELAEKEKFYVEFITREDYPRLNEFDALFIRETTNVNHYTYRFARRAEAQGLIVIDDPLSILRCTNKVYLAELLKNHRIPTPKTAIIHPENKHDAITDLGFPMILKLPDSAFSQGVVKVQNEEEYLKEAKNLLNQSEIIIGQEYVYTDFDWRVGVLDDEVIFVCKYFMAKDHWQIYNWQSDNDDITGDFECVPVNQVPDFILNTALKATKLIGKGLYGVDIKEVNGRAVVIEINDNPSIDAGVEDQLCGDEVYKKVIHSIQRRIEALYETPKPAEARAV